MVPLAQRKLHRHPKTRRNQIILSNKAAACPKKNALQPQWQTCADYWRIKAGSCIYLGRNGPRADSNPPTADRRGLGALIAKKFAAEGCYVAINYVSNLERARETAVKIEELESYGKKVVLVQGVCNFVLSTSSSISLFMPI